MTDSHLKRDDQRVKFDAVAYEDVLAARVLRKAVSAMGIVLGLFAATIAFVWLDVRNQRAEVEAQRAALSAKRDSLTRDVAELRRAFANMNDSIRGNLELAAKLVEHAGTYESALAGQLTSIGRMQRTVEYTTGDVESANTRATAALDSILGLRNAYERRTALDAESLKVFRGALTARVNVALESALTANYLVLNRWGQVVEEERKTPIADSRFWVRFDDIRDNYLTHTQVWFDDGRGQQRVPDVPSTLRVRDSVFVKSGGAQYLLLAQSQYRDRAWFGAHNDRVVFRVERLVPDSSLGLALHAAPSTRQ
jgi:uncharacterized protein YodC (DUF2158 family)